MAITVMGLAMLGAFVSAIYYINRMKREHESWIAISLLVAGTIIAAATIILQQFGQIKNERTMELLEAQAKEQQAVEALNAFRLGAEARPYIEISIVIDQLKLQLDEEMLDPVEWHSLLGYFQDLERDVKAHYWALGLQEPGIEHIGSPATVEDVLSQLRASGGPVVASWFAVGFYSRFALHRVELELGRPFKRLYRYRPVSESPEGTNLLTPELFELHVVDTLDIPPLSSEKWIEKFEQAAEEVPLPQEIVSPFAAALRNPLGVDLDEAFNDFSQKAERVLREQL